MKIYLHPAENTWNQLCRRCVSHNADIESSVKKILEKVRMDGDSAIRSLTRKIDGTLLDSLKVSREDISRAADSVSDTVRSAVDAAIANITAFHKAQKPSEITVETAPGVRCTQRPVALTDVGLYIPGGTAPLFSTVLMLAVPARIAGCPRIAMCSPCDRNGQIAPAVLYAADRCGIDEIYRIGGAMAIGAMAYGTESVRPVRKIFGPGNRYVTTAKQFVNMQGTAIDMPAGPSEVMVLADSSADPEFVAADILSQCEHGSDSQAVVVCDSKSIAKEIADATAARASRLARQSYVTHSLANSRIIVFGTKSEMIRFANRYAPEHLILSLHDSRFAVSGITNAGSVFLGNFSPESAGDYASGTNHTLPTGGWAASISGVNTESFMRKMTIQEISREGISRLAPTIMAMAEAEGLDAHADAVKVRLKTGMTKQ